MSRRELPAARAPLPSPAGSSTGTAGRTRPVATDSVAIEQVFDIVRRLFYSYADVFNELVEVAVNI